MKPNASVDTSWQAYANCMGLDTELFFPERGAQLEAAKAVCAGCSVRASCLQHALTHGEREGVWGGLSSRERRKLQRKRRVRACRQCGELFEAATNQQRLCGPACRADRRSELA